MTEPRTEADDKIVAAIRAHMQWRVRLQDAITRKAPLDGDEIGNDRLCDLGCWIDTLQPEFGQSFEWQHLHEVHHAFHREAAQVAQLIADEKTLEAAASVREGDYAAASARILDALLRLRDLLGPTR